MLKTSEVRLGTTEWVKPDFSIHITLALVQHYLVEVVHRFPLDTACQPLFVLYVSFPPVHTSIKKYDENYIKCSRGKQGNILNFHMTLTPLYSNSGGGGAQKSGPKLVLTVIDLYNDKEG